MLQPHWKRRRTSLRGTWCPPYLTRAAMRGHGQLWRGEPKLNHFDMVTGGFPVLDPAQVSQAAQGAQSSRFPPKKRCDSFGWSTVSAWFPCRSSRVVVGLG